MFEVLPPHTQTPPSTPWPEDCHDCPKHFYKESVFYLDSSGG